MPKKTYYRKGKKSKDAKQDRRIAKIENVIGKVELKARVFYQAQQANTVGISGYTVSNIQQGSDYFEREADQISPRRLDVHWFVQNNDAAIIAFVRAMLIRVNNSSGTVTAANLLDLSVGSTVFAHANPVYTKIPMKNKLIGAGEEYEILWDSGVKELLPYAAAGGAGPNCIVFNKKFKLDPKKPVHYTGAGLATEQFGKLFWCILSNVATAVNGGQTELYYTDIN